jgi:hypothetical protein
MRWNGDSFGRGRGEKLDRGFARIGTDFKARDDLTAKGDLKAKNDLKLRTIYG